MVGFAGGGVGVIKFSVVIEIGWVSIGPPPDGPPVGGLWRVSALRFRNVKPLRHSVHLRLRLRRRIDEQS